MLEYPYQSLAYLGSQVLSDELSWTMLLAHRSDVRTSVLPFINDVY